MMRRLQKNQQGLVSITVSLIIMMIITLVVSSFALIVRREQRRTLDRQLSTQAFYAAEAGIADAQSALQAGLITNDINQCSGNGSFVDIVNTAYSNTNGSNNISDNVSYSCVLINKNLLNYVKHGVRPEDGSFVASIKANSPINSLRISWQNNDDTQITNYNANYTLTPNIDGPMLRVTIFPGFNGQALSKATINSSAHTMFLYPNTGGQNPSPSGDINYLGSDGGVNSTSPEQGQFVDGNCNPSNRSTADDFFECNVNINGLSANEYYVVVQPLYKTAKVSLTAYNGTDNRLTLPGGQAEIDVTGKAADVLRRVKVRVPVDGGVNIGDFKGLFPDAAISTKQDLCKRIELTGNNSYVDNCNNASGSFSP